MTTTNAHWKNLIAADGNRLAAYIVEPTGKPRGSVVVLQEIFGVNSHIQAVAESYAAQGWRAIAPSTFARVEADVNLGYTAADMARGFALKTAVDALPAPDVLADIQAAIDEVSPAGNVGIVGFCWGGLLSWRAACELKGLTAAVTYYGGGMTMPPDIGRRPQVPVLSHFGDHDEYIPLDSIEAFRKAHSEVEAYVYPAHHGFNCDQRASYEAASALLARERSFDFFRKHLG